MSGSDSSPRGSPPIILNLSEAGADHLAVAIRAHCNRAVEVGLRVPAELRQVEAMMMSARASRGRRVPPVEVPPPARNPEVVRRLVSYSEAAAMLCCSVRTVKRRVAAGQLRPVRDAGIVRLRIADLDAFINRNGD